MPDFINYAILRDSTFEYNSNALESLNSRFPFRSLLYIVFIQVGVKWLLIFSRIDKKRPMVGIGLYIANPKN